MLYIHIDLKIILKDWIKRSTNCPAAWSCLSVLPLSWGRMRMRVVILCRRKVRRLRDERRRLLRLLLWRSAVELRQRRRRRSPLGAEGLLKRLRRVDDDGRVLVLGTRGASAFRHLNAHEARSYARINMHGMDRNLACLLLKIHCAKNTVNLPNLFLFQPVRH